MQIVYTTDLVANQFHSQRDVAVALQVTKRNINSMPSKKTSSSTDGRGIR